MRTEITKEVEEISRSLEETCLRKLNADAKLAVEKVSTLSSRLEEKDKRLEEVEKENAVLHADLDTKKLRMEIAESLLQEFLRQLQRKVNARKEVGVQAYVVTRRNAETSRRVILLPP